MWSKIEQERTIEVYKEILGSVITNHKRSLDVVAKQMLIRGNILRYDFTKRQLSIIYFVLTLSFNLGKEWAFIPRLVDFETAGISKYKVKAEISKLIDMGVLEWNQEEKLYGIREPKFWKAPLNMGFKNQRSRELFLLNLSHNGVDTDTVVKKIEELESDFF